MDCWIIFCFITTTDNNLEDAKKKKSEEETKSSSNGETQVATPTTERSKGKLEKKKKGKDKSEKTEGKVIYDRVRVVLTSFIHVFCTHVLVRIVGVNIPPIIIKCMFLGLLLIHKLNGHSFSSCIISLSGLPLE